MRVLVACEVSGRVREAFAARGHDAWSCDLLPSELPGQHVQMDALAMVYSSGDRPWDLLIAFPPCTYLCASGLHWNRRRPERESQTEAAVEFVQRLVAAPIAKIAIENPVGCLSRRLRAPNQIIQPYQFGEDASKATCLWLYGLPELTPTRFVRPRMVNGRPRWSNQTDSGQNRLSPSERRASERARTYAGIADAMAAQWGPAEAVAKAA